MLMQKKITLSNQSEIMVDVNFQGSCCKSQQFIIHDDL